VKRHLKGSVLLSGKSSQYLMKMKGHVRKEFVEGKPSTCDSLDIVVFIQRCSWNFKFWELLAWSFWVNML